MISPLRLAWQWHDVPEPARPQAAIAVGPAARLLLDRLRRDPAPEDGAALLATANADMLVVLGPEAALPWVPGIAYAAPAADAPSLWLPVLRRPSVPCDLLADALGRRHDRQPLLLWPEPASIVPLDRQVPVTPALIERIAALWAAG